MLNSCFMYQITDEPQENCLQHKNRDISSSLRKPAEQVATYGAPFISNYRGRNGSPGKCHCHGLCCVCAVSGQLQLLQGKSALTEAEQIPPPVGHSWAALNRHRKLREKSLEIPVFGWKVRDIFVFKDTEVPCFSWFIPQSRGRITKISKTSQILGQVCEQIKAALCDWDSKLLWNENQYTI